MALKYCLLYQVLWIYTVIGVVLKSLIHLPAQFWNKCIVYFYILGEHDREFHSNSPKNLRGNLATPNSRRMRGKIASVFSFSHVAPPVDISTTLSYNNQWETYAIDSSARQFTVFLGNIEP